LKEGPGEWKRKNQGSLVGLLYIHLIGILINYFAKEKYPLIDIQRLDDYGAFLIKNNKMETAVFLKYIDATAPDN
jgi:hypothetical protein